jgi:DNA-binding HxlR family transcriptional regulator
MSGENPPNDFNRDRAELFEALGHPTRIKILQVLLKSPLGFSALKRETGIESNGLLSFHLGKLEGLIKIVDGNYALTDEGKDALRIMAVEEKITTEPIIRHSITPLHALLIVLGVALVISVGFSVFYYQQQNIANDNLNQLYLRTYVERSFNYTVVVESGYGSTSCQYGGMGWIEPSFVKIINLVPLGGAKSLSSIPELNSLNSKILNNSGLAFYPNTYSYQYENASHASTESTTYSNTTDCLSVSNVIDDVYTGQLTMIYQNGLANVTFIILSPIGLSANQNTTQINYVIMQVQLPP